MVIAQLRKFFAGAISKLDERSSRRRTEKQQRQTERLRVKTFIGYFGFTPGRKTIHPAVDETDVLNVASHLQRLGSRFIMANKAYLEQRGVVWFHLRLPDSTVPQDVSDTYERLFEERRMAFTHFSEAFAMAKHFQYQPMDTGLESYVPDREQNVILMEIIAPEQLVTEEIFDVRECYPV